MKTIRKGNDIVVRWRIFRYGQKYDIALYRESISLVLSNMGEKKEITDYSIVDVNTIVFKYRAEDQGLGIYRLLLIDKSRNSTRIIEECNAFRLVNTSDAANNDDTLESAITITLTSELTAPADGLSAYEVALQNGFIGTEEEWLQSLKGEQGPQGIQGDKGDKGDRGEQGDKGLSAYQVAIANGFVGTEAEWLQSLVPDTTDIELAEAQRQAKELERIEAENARKSAELERQNASTEAVASANEAASNANEAAITAQQKAGEANTAASSANAVVEGFNSIIVQEKGNLQDKVMSQKAVTDALIASDQKLSELLSKLNKVDNICVQVTDYSGIDFATKFQNAINDTSLKSLTILIPPGSYTLPNKLVVPNNAKPFKIVGQPSYSSNGSSIITAPNGFIESRTFEVVAIEIEGVTLIGGAASVGISLSSRWAKVHNIFMRGYSVGIDFDCAYGVMSDIEIYNCAKGVTTTPVGTIIQNCHIHGCSVAGIETDGGNALSVDGCVFEDNGIHVNINTTEFVDIQRTYMGDGSTIFVKNTGGVNVNIHDMLQYIGGPGGIVEQSSGSMKISGKFYSITDGINLSGGVLDLSDLKMYLGRSFINRTGGELVMNASKYQVGYKLVVNGDGVTEPTNMRGYVEHSTELNYAGLPKWNVMSELREATPNVNWYKPGVQFHFKFPKYMVGQKVYLFQQGIANRQPYDMFVKGGRFLGFSAFLSATLNLISESRLRLSLNSYPFHNIPITLDSEDLYVTLALNQTGDPRDVASVIDFLYVSEDNSFCYPTEWVQETL